MGNAGTERTTVADDRREPLYGRGVTTASPGSVYCEPFAEWDIDDDSIEPTHTSTGRGRAKLPAFVHGR